MRSLPKRKNPLTAPGQAPSYEELINRRRLGKTKLAVQPGQVGTSNATKAENLGLFEYAHLRAPLPLDLKSSEIFATQQNQSHPETYFLMRRSKDGFVSATGMFRIAFPWAQLAEEKAERAYLKTKEATSMDDAAGNVWIAPEFALELAAEYGLLEWIRALLDPLEIAQTPNSARKAHIRAPPKFEFSLDSKLKLDPPSSSSPTSSTSKTPARSRSMRSTSPTKIASPTKGSVKASPRKRQTKAMKEAALANANAASEILQHSLNDAASSVPTPAAADDKVKVEVEQSVDVTGTTETTTTNITVEMPASSPDLPMPEDAESMIETARRMVQEARALEASSSSPKPSPKASRKRKVSEVEPSDEKETELSAQQPAKKARVLEENLKREKVRTRAMLGVAATLTIAAAIPYFF